MFHMSIHTIEFGQENYNKEKEMKRITLTICTLAFCLSSYANEITFIKSQNETVEPQCLIRSTVSRNCKSAYGNSLSLHEVLSEIFCDYENKWCEIKGFSVLKTVDGISVVVQFEENWGAFRVTDILSNSDLVNCKKP